MGQVPAPRSQGAAGAGCQSERHSRASGSLGRGGGPSLWEAPWGASLRGMEDLQKACWGPQPRGGSSEAQRRSPGSGKCQNLEGTAGPGRREGGLSRDGTQLQGSCVLGRGGRSGRGNPNSAEVGINGAGVLAGSRRGESTVRGPSPQADRVGGSQRERVAVPAGPAWSLTFEEALQRLRLVHHLHVRPARRALRPGPATARPGGAASPARPARPSRLGSRCRPARPAAAFAPSAALARPLPAPHAPRPPAARRAPCRPAAAPRRAGCARLLLAALGAGGAPNRVGGVAAPPDPCAAGGQDPRSPRLPLG